MCKVTLKAARVNANLKQEDAAKAIGVSKTTIIKWEQGETTPRVNQAQALCNLYNIPLDAVNFLPEL